MAPRPPFGCPVDGRLLRGAVGAERRSRRGRPSGRRRSRAGVRARGALRCHCGTRLLRSSCGCRHGDHRVVALAGDAAGELLGRRLRVVALGELGRWREFDADVAAFERLADTIRQPLYAWYAPLWRGMRALMEGRTDDVDVLCGRAEAIGELAHSENAAMLTMSQRLLWLMSTGRADECYARTMDIIDRWRDIGFMARPGGDGSDASRPLRRGAVVPGARLVRRSSRVGRGMASGGRDGRRSSRAPRRSRTGGAALRRAVAVSRTQRARRDRRGELGLDRAPAGNAGRGHRPRRRRPRAFRGRRAPPPRRGRDAPGRGGRARRRGVSRPE